MSKALSALAALGTMALLLLPGAAGADWLVTREGARVETAGRWQVNGRLVVFTRPDGSLASLRLSEVDLEASGRVTTEAEEAPPEAPPPAPEKKKSKIVLTDADFQRKPPPAAAPEGEASSQAVSPQGQEGGSVRKSPVVVGSWRQAARTGEDGLDIFGVLQNTGEAFATEVTVAVELYSDTGEKLASGSGVLSAPGIRPGGSVTFRAAFPGVFTFAEARFEVKNRTLTIAPLPEADGGEGQDGAAPPGA
jgi:hypothetical protein